MPHNTVTAFRILGMNPPQLCGVPRPKLAVNFGTCGKRVDPRRTSTSRSFPAGPRRCSSSLMAVSYCRRILAFCCFVRDSSIAVAMIFVLTWAIQEKQSGYEQTIFMWPDVTRKMGPGLPTYCTASDACGDYPCHQHAAYIQNKGGNMKRKGSLSRPLRLRAGGSGTVVTIPSTVLADTTKFELQDFKHTSLLAQVSLQSPPIHLHRRAWDAFARLGSILPTSTCQYHQALLFCHRRAALP